MQNTFDTSLQAKSSLTDMKSQVEIPAFNATPLDMTTTTKNSTSSFADTVKNIGDFKAKKMAEEVAKKTQTASPEINQSSENDFDLFKQAVAMQESSNNYKAVSPANRNGQKAYGKYQVLESNIPSWTQKYLGQSLSVQDFVNSPEAQEKIAEAKFKELYGQYKNWDDVASIWFSGRPLTGNTSSDVTGKTVPQYIQDIRNFMKANPDKKTGKSGGLSSVVPGGVLTTPYGGSTKFEANHPAIDIAAPKGTPIMSLASGKVTSVEKNKSGYGNSIIVTDQNGTQFRYSHLHQNFIRVGDTVKKGQQIASTGNSGNVYSTSGGDGTHLDLRIKSAAGKYLNPTSFL